MKRWIALLIALVMLTGLLPAGVFAQAAPPKEFRIIAPETDDTRSGDGTETGYGLGYVPLEQVGSRSLTDAYLRSVENRSYRSDLPARYDSRDYGYIPTAVYNQGDYGACWCFASLTAVESYMIKHGVVDGATGLPAATDINLSEYQLAWFTYSKAYDKLGMLEGDETYLYWEDPSNPAEAKLNAGGNVYWSGYTLMRWEGAAPETASALAFNSVSSAGLDPSYAWQYDSVHVQSRIIVSAANAAAVKKMLMEFGAGTISYYMVSENNDYYNPETAAYYDPDHESTNHAVTLVGWDDDYPATNFNEGRQPSANGAWICKNSWGEDWGNGGYFYLSYEDLGSRGAVCGFFAAEGTDNYDNIYQYDGTISWYDADGGVDAGANTFTAFGDERLEAIAFETEDEALHYEISVYLDPESAEDPTSGVLAAQQSGTLAYPGYYTIKLETPVLLKAGQRYSVAVSYALDEGNPWIPIDYSDNEGDGPRCSHTAGAGQSAALMDGVWSGTGDGYSFRIKAYTTDLEDQTETMQLRLFALGQLSDTIEGAVGALYTLPAEAPALEGWHFVGWTQERFLEAETAPASFLPGETILLDPACADLYALYQADMDENTAFELVQTDPGDWSGYYALTSTTDESGYILNGMEVYPGAATTVYYCNDAIADTGVHIDGTTLTGGSLGHFYEIKPLDDAWMFENVQYGSWLMSFMEYLCTTSTFFQSYFYWDLSMGENGAVSAYNRLEGEKHYIGVHSDGRIELETTPELYLWKAADRYCTEKHEHVEGMAVKENETAPTCTEAGGYDTVVYCAECGSELSRVFTEIPALGHDYHAAVTMPTCTEGGFTTFKCFRCGDTYTAEETEARGHTPGEPVVENMTEATCTEAGGYDTVTICTVCGEEASREHTEIPALGHDLVTDAAVPATCTAPGLTAGEHCTRCDYKVAQEVAPALGHDLVDHEAKAPTCAELGWDAYQTCTRCDYTTYKEIAPIGHTPAEAVKENEVAPTCTEAGAYDEVVYCSVCSAELSRETKTTEALGHDYVGGVCAVCGEKDPDYTEPTEEPTEAPTEATEPTEAPTEPTEAPTEPTTEPTEPGEAAVPGDVNGDGEVDTIDSIRLAKFLVELVELTDEQTKAADVNGDGDVTTTDAIRLAKYLVGLIDSLQPEPTKAASRLQASTARMRVVRIK